MTASQRLKRYWPNAALFALIAVVLLYVQWITNAHLVLNEPGDFSANSLLILEAKRLALLHGNYSRIGVYHPGPAILYVLAAGEVLFHDMLHLAPSPFSGQLLAVCFYSAGWLVLIFAMMRRVLQAWLPALLFTAVFAGMIGYLTPSVFLGIWPPDLYILPFSAMLVAVGRLAYGKTDCLRPLAVASGFVINGHVSFIPMLGVILIFMLAANWLITRRDRSLCILTPTYLVRHRRELLIATGILFLFFVPLLILTMREWPGPVYDYVKFGGIDKHISLPDAVKFVGFYWGGAIGLRWGILLLFIAVKGVRGPSAQLVRDARSIGIAMVAATLAVLVYAKFGVDHVEYTYVGLFYYSVPAMMTAVIVLYAYHAVRSSVRLLLAGLALIAAVYVTWNSITEPVYYDENFNIEGSAQLYEQLRALPGTGRIVFDVEAKPGDWDKVWGNIAGLLLYTKRHGEDLICINQNWHLLFKKENRCRPEELNNSRHYYVRYMNLPDQELGDPDIEGQALLLYRHGRVNHPGAYTMLTDHKEYFRSILGKGWGDLEGEFVWSAAPVAEINLPADPARTGSIRLDVGYYRWERKSGQQLEVLVNGKSVGQWRFNPLESRRQVKVDLGDDPTAAQHIELKIANPMSPLQLGISQDHRQLGVSLYGIRTKQE